jgi:phosphoglycerate dehydrogenase-like enzyme
MYGKTAGVIGTGKIGVAALRILKGFGMRLLAFDPYQVQPRWSWAWNMSICQRSFHSLT